MTESKLDNFGPGFVPGKGATSSDQAVSRALEHDYNTALNDRIIGETHQGDAKEG